MDVMPSCQATDRELRARATAANDWPGRRGRVGLHLDALIAEGELRPKRTVVYLCGSLAMIEGSSTRLAAFGIPDHAIKRERFVTTWD
jgi:ferredoxin-NADP reductase